MTNKQDPKSQDQITQQAVLFADLSGSSALYKKMGNLKAKEVIDGTLQLMGTITRSQGGSVVKTIGDEIMARFDSAEAGCRAAMEIQRRSQQMAEQRQPGLTTRIGMDFGHALLDDDDVFGDTVNDAACVTQIARPNQIVVTQAVVDALPERLREDCEEFDRILIKGEQEKSLIYRLRWESSAESQNATTVMSVNHITQRLSTRQLHLTFSQQVFMVTPDDIPFIIGRDHRRAHLHVDSSLASRDHCHIELRRGKFVLVDHSTNGTYVTNADQPEIYLRREEIPLVGEGTIAIGSPAGADSKLVIQFSH